MFYICRQNKNTNEHFMNNDIITLENPVPRMPELRFRTPVNWTISKGQQWCVIGPNGAGKTLLADMILGRIAIRDIDGEIRYGFDAPVSEAVKSIAFKDIYSIVDSSTTYYQQRWHATEQDGISTVREMLADNEKYAEGLFRRFGVESVLDKKIISLSSGELRKFLLIRVLLARPKVLIVDNPYIGLDEESRRSLDGMFAEMAAIDGLQVILLLANPADIPPMVTHVLPVYGMECLGEMTRSEFMADTALQEKLFPMPGQTPQLPAAVRKPSGHEVTFRMENVQVKHGNREIVKDINWEVRNGEKWGLLGPNGSGKSTLLSLVYADNPQSYANTIYLFDRRRGTGESIWEIKERIGYVSPDMHLYYMEDIPALQIVASGFFDSIGLFRRCTPQQAETVMQWMKTFGIESLAERSFLKLSSGQQRMALLARAFVKDPDLLILDEPLHGLDISSKRLASGIIEAFCRREGKTLIYVTHYPHEMPPSVTRIFRLKKRTEAE